MSDPNAPRGEQPDPSEQPVDGFAVTDEQHAPPSAPAAPGVGEPATSFSSPAVTPEVPGQPAFSADGQGSAPRFGEQSTGGASAAPRPGEEQYGQQQGQPPYGQPRYEQPQPGQPQYGQPQDGQPQYGQPQYGQPGQPGQPPYGQPQYGAGQQQYGGQPQYGAGQPQYGAPGQPQYAAAAPMSPVDEKNAGMWGHLSGLSTIVTGGFGGWIGPLIVYMIYKDRSAFARQESKEALNFGIFMTILAIGILIVGSILALVTLGILAFLPALYWVPGLLQVIFGIIGAIRVNNGGSYRYPFNWRMVK
jgi:uncharacterized protein